MEITERRKFVGFGNLHDHQPCEFHKVLGSIPQVRCSLICVAFFQPGPLGTLLGPTLAEDQPKTKKNQKHIYIYIILFSQSESK